MAIFHTSLFFFFLAHTNIWWVEMIILEENPVDPGSDPFTDNWQVSIMLDSNQGSYMDGLFWSLPGQLSPSFSDIKQCWSHSWASDMELRQAWHEYTQPAVDQLQTVLAQIEMSAALTRNSLLLPPHPGTLPFRHSFFDLCQGGEGSMRLTLSTVDGKVCWGYWAAPATVLWWDSTC